MESAAQTQYMSETEREEFLKLFETEREESFVGFCVMGGIFSEGIDLGGRPADRGSDCRDRTSTGVQ